MCTKTSDCGNIINAKAHRLPYERDKLNSQSDNRNLPRSNATDHVPVSSKLQNLDGGDVRGDRCKCLPLWIEHGCADQRGNQCYVKEMDRRARTWRLLHLQPRVGQASVHGILC